MAVGRWSLWSWWRPLLSKGCLNLRSKLGLGVPLGEGSELGGVKGKGSLMWLWWFWFHHWCCGIRFGAFLAIKGHPLTVKWSTAERECVCE